MLKLLLGNAIFATCIGCWYLYCDGDRSMMLAGIMLAFPCFVSGIFMGYILRAPEKKRRVREPQLAMATEQLHAELAEPEAEQGDGAVHEVQQAGGEGDAEVAALDPEKDAVAHDHALHEEHLSEVSVPADAAAVAESEHARILLEDAQGAEVHPAHVDHADESVAESQETSSEKSHAPVVVADEAG